MQCIFLRSLNSVAILVCIIINVTIPSQVYSPRASVVLDTPHAQDLSVHLESPTCVMWTLTRLRVGSARLQRTSTNVLCQA